MPSSNHMSHAASVTPWKQAIWSIIAIVGLTLILFFPTLRDMMEVWRSSPTYNHGFLIAPISAVLIWMRRDLLVRTTPYLSPLALSAVTGSLILHLIGTKLDFQIVQHFALVALIIAIIVTLIGVSTAKLIFFPLAFLFFAAPAGEELVPFLQNFTAATIVIILNILNIPVYQDGVFLYTSSGDFEVAEACAGLRFLVAMIMVAALFAHLSYNSWRKKITFIAASVVLPIIANAIRAIAIVLIATWSDHKYATGFDHIVYGWGFFAVILVTLLLIGNHFADMVITQPNLPLQKAPIPTTKYRLWLALVLLALLMPAALLNAKWAPAPIVVSGE